MFISVLKSPFISVVNIVKKESVKQMGEVQNINCSIFTFYGAIQTLAVYEDHNHYLDFVSSMFLGS